MSRTFSAQRLRQARQAAHLSREQVARKVGRSVYTVVDYEKGRARPGVDGVAALADALGCPIEALYSEAVADVVAA